mgnify:CR=1 FL=1
MFSDAAPEAAWLASEAEASAGAVAAAAVEAEGEAGVQRGVNAPVADPGLRKKRPSDSKASNLT